MTEQQFEGRSVAEAAIKACEVLGVTRSALRYKVVSETGELLQRRVVIAVEGIYPPAPPQTSAAPRVARDAGDGAAPGNDDGHHRSAAERAPEQDDGGAADTRGRRSPRRDRDGNGDRAPRGRGGERSGRSGRSDRGSRGGRGTGRGERPRRPDDDGIEALLKLDSQPASPPIARAAIEAKTPRAQRVLTVVADLVRLMKMQVDPRLVADEEVELHVDLAGADEARLIGRKGEVLLALQFVINRIISRGEDDSGQVVVLDAGGYRQRRRAALEELARRLAERAMQEKKAVRLSPMSAHDRRVFHMTLKEIEGVTTRSEGDGLYRNLLIIPSEFA